MPSPGEGACLGEADVYKITRNSELVVKRKLALYRGRFYTFQEGKQASKTPTR